MVQSSQWFLSYPLAGKPPLIYWFYAIFTPQGVDPLLIGRLISLVAGLGTVIVLMHVSTRNWGASVGRTAGLLYALSPIHIFYDGLALPESVLVLLFALLCSTLLDIDHRAGFWHVLQVSIIVGVSIWVKNTGLLYLLTALALYVYFWKCRLMTGYQFIASSLFMLFVTQLIIFPLLTHKEFSHVLAFQSLYALTPKEITHLPLSVWFANLRDMLLVFAAYVSPVLLLTGTLAIFYKRFDDRTNALKVILLVTSVLLILTGRTLHSRYTVFVSVPLILLSAPILKNYKKLFIATIATMGTASSLLSLNTPQFFHIFPQIGALAADTYQYVDGWPSGYGVMEALAYVDTHRGTRQSFVGVRRDGGNPEDAVMLYAPRLHGLAVNFLDPIMDDFSGIVRTYATMPMYFITRNGQYGYLQPNLTLLTRFSKPYGNESVEVLRFQP